MRAIILLSVFFVIALLLSGCAQTSSPSAPSAPASAYSAPAAAVPTVPASDNNAPPAVPPGVNTTAGANANGTNTPPNPSSSSCSLSLGKLQIIAGQAIILTMRANPGFGQTATYSCGSTTETLGTNGLFNDWKQCKFDTPGNITVWMAINGQPCASANLEVLPANGPASAGSCWITPGSRNYSMDNGLRTYAATVNYANYSSGAVLSWDCAWKSFQQSLSSGGVNAPQYLSGSIIVNCQYATDPGTLTTLPVRMNADSCGDILK